MRILTCLDRSIYRIMGLSIIDRIPMRMCLIFIPAIIRGEWRSAGLYAPFMFSYVLSAVRNELFRATKEGFMSDLRFTQRIAITFGDETLILPHQHHQICDRC